MVGDNRLHGLRMNLVCRGPTAAYHFLDLLPESLVYQSIHNGVNGRVEVNHCVSDDDGVTKVIGAKVSHDVNC